MEGIGEIITQADLLSLKRYSEQTINQRLYVAPTVYRYAAAPIANWPYYATLAEAMNQYRYVTGYKGLSASKPKGTIAFLNNGKAQTLGINVDFFTYINMFGTSTVPYAYCKEQYAKPGKFIAPFRFYKTDGSGPFYSILSSDVFGISATVVSNVAPDKVAALEKFHKEIQLLKSKYNTLSLYLTDLSKKKLKPAQQQIFNEGLLLKSTLEQQIKNIKGIDVTYSANGQIGVIPLVVIVIIALVAGVVGWTAITIAQEAAKVAKINAAFDMQKWIAEQKLKLATAKNSGAITQADYDAQTQSLDKAAANADTVINANSKSEPGFMDKAQNLLLIGGGIFLVSKIIK